MRMKLFKAEEDSQMLKNHLTGLQAQNESLRVQVLDAERKLNLTATQIKQKDGKLNSFEYFHNFT